MFSSQVAFFSFKKNVNQINLILCKKQIIYVILFVHLETINIISKTVCFQSQLNAFSSFLQHVEARYKCMMRVSFPVAIQDLHDDLSKMSGGVDVTLYHHNL